MTLKSNYVEPISGKTATVKLTTTDMEDNYNLRVVYHKENLCQVESSKLIGMINSRTVGYPNHKEITIKVEAGSEIGFSMPQIYMGSFGGFNGGTTSINMYQPLTVFTPEEGEVYEVNFSPTTAKVYKRQGNNAIVEPSSNLDTSCNVGNTNLGEVNQGELFFLHPKN
ncbi:hypothetical protein [Pseudoalteromonas sp. MMG005]|uniref:hypothetical protein n=1 Tax=Pseudoalteromonas sp. MMG005 TaxID=2822682 RepID=UPI001B3A0317|nr:hypothetical protein [Pseudoalteromonas sp. MMG005]MBQ4848209.1 hypothetical protein [Pseudoalteromonas sp. MMG005]